MPPFGGNQRKQGLDAWLVPSLLAGAPAVTHLDANLIQVPPRD